MMDFSSFTAAPRNQKKKTYGKRPATNHHAFAQFAESPQKPKAAQSTWSPSPSPEPAKVVTPISKPAAGKLKRPSPRPPRDADMFDVPASDSEQPGSPRPENAPRSPKSQQPSQRRTKSPGAHTASRDRNLDGGKAAFGKRKRDIDAAEAQLLQENAIFQNGTRPRVDIPIQMSKTKTNGPKTLAKPPAKPIRARSPAAVNAKTASNADSHKQVPRPASKPATTVQALNNNLSSRPGLWKEKVRRTPDDFDESERDDEPGSFKRPRSHSSSGPRTPPPKSTSPGSIASLTRSGSATPRQNELWSKLLGTADSTDSPSRLAVDQLRITSATKSLASSLFPRSAAADKPPAPARRGRLIDTLAKTNADTSAEMEGDEDESMADDTSELETSSEDLATTQHLQAEVAAASSSQGPSKITYGQVRSYMDESSLEAELMLDSPIVPIRPPPKSTFGSQGQSSYHAPAASKDDDEKEDDSHGPIKSVHELRAKGESRRFVDDFENLLDDVQHRNSASWSRQRSGIMELCEKLMDKQYVNRMVDAGLDERLLRACSDASDTIFNFVVAAVIALIGSAEVSLTVLRHTQQSECFEMLLTLLPLETDVKVMAKDRKSNMSKVAQGSFVEFCTRLTANPSFGGGESIILSPHLMALTAIEAVLKRMRRLGHMDDLLDEQKTSTLLQVLERRVNDREQTAKHLERSLELALSTLEAGSVIPGRIQSAWTPKRMDRLAKLLPNMLDPNTANAGTLTPLALRLMLNLTNGKATASTAFADARLVQLLVSAINHHFKHLSENMKPGSEEEAALDDRLILSLGAMINLAEFSDLARTSLLGDHLHLLHGLVDTFLSNRGKAAEADSLALTASNVAYGYLAVLLGNLCESEQVRRAVAAKLPDGNMRSLVEAIDEFVAYNKVADRSAYENEEGGKVWRVFTERLANVAEKLREPW